MNNLKNVDKNELDNKTLPAWLQHQAEVRPEAPTPPWLLVTGPGGVGKSFLINTLRLLAQVWSAEDPLTPRAHGGMLICAPTGVTSFNIAASTIHNTFKIPVEKVGKSTFKNLY